MTQDDELLSHLRWLIGGSIIFGAMLMLTIFFVVIGTAWRFPCYVTDAFLAILIGGSYDEILKLLTGESESPRLVEDYDEREGLQ